MSQDNNDRFAQDMIQGTLSQAANPMLHQGGGAWIKDKPIHAVVNSKTSFIEPHEEEEAKRIVNEAFKIASKGRDFNFRPCGYMIAVRIYMRPEEITTITRDDGTTATLWRPDSVSAEDKYRSCTGVVMAVGPQAYQGRRADGSPLYPGGSWVNVGDIVCFARNACMRMDYRGVALAILTDDSVIATLEDPEDITPEHQRILT